MAKYQITVQDIFFEIARVLKTLYPNSKVHQERIADLKTPAFSIELIQYSTPIFSQDIINKRVDLDIIYFTNNDTVAEALEVQELLSSAFSMGLTVYERDKKGEIIRNDEGGILYKRFIHCLKPPEYTLVDQDLHYMVTFEFADNYKPIYVTLDEVNLDGLIAKEPMVTEFNTASQTIENIDLVFTKDEGRNVDESKMNEYAKEEYQFMKDLKTELSSISATIEIEKG